MCYPKPGPRCSNHTMKAYNRAVEKHGADSPEAQEALDAWLHTPAGIKQLRAEGHHDLAEARERHRRALIKSYHGLVKARRTNERNSRIYLALWNGGSAPPFRVQVKTEDDGTVVIYVEHMDMNECVQTWGVDESIESMDGLPVVPDVIYERDELVGKDIREVIGRRYAALIESVHEWGPQVADWVSPSALQDAVGEGVPYRVEESYNLKGFRYTVASYLESFRSMWYDHYQGEPTMEVLDTLLRIKGTRRSGVTKARVEERLRNASAEDVQAWSEDAEHTAVAHLARKELARRRRAQG